MDSSRISIAYWTFGSLILCRDGICVIIFTCWCLIRISGCRKIRTKCIGCKVIQCRRSLISWIVSTVWIMQITMFRLSKLFIRIIWCGWRLIWWNGVIGMLMWEWLPNCWWLTQKTFDHFCWHRSESLIDMHSWPIFKAKTSIINEYVKSIGLST